MANIFGILTALVLALTAFVAYKNKDAYANELDHRKNEDRKLAASQDRLKTAQDKLAATQKERAETEAEVVQLKSQEADQKKVNEGLKQDIESKTQTVEANKKKLDEIRAKTAPVGEIKELAAKVKTMRTEMEATKQAISDNETKITNLTAENVQTEGTIEVMKSETEMITRQESFFTKTRINSIYPNWGFVTLGAGHLAGVVTGSTLEIVRNSEAVAKLLVTAVERSTASASIIPDSVVEGTVLMVGDQVRPVHKAPKTPAKPAKPAPLSDDTPATDPKPATPPAAGLTADPIAEPDAKPATETAPATETTPATETKPADETKPAAAPETN